MWLADCLATFKRDFAESVRLILPDAAQPAVLRDVLDPVLDQPPYTEARGGAGDPSLHVTLTTWAELFLVLPASAAIIGKAATGIADDLLSAAIAAGRPPVIFASGMSLETWNRPAVQLDIAAVKKAGHVVIPARAEAAADGGAGWPTAEIVLRYLWHHHMRGLRARYWAEATAAPPATPAAAANPLTIQRTAQAR